MEQILSFYHNIKNTLVITDKLTEDTYHQNYIYLLDDINYLSVNLPNIFSQLLSNKDYFKNQNFMIDEAFFLTVLQQLLQAQKDEDYILFNDLIQVQIVPLLLEMQDIIRKNEEIFSPSGFNMNNYTRLYPAMKTTNKIKLEKRNPTLYNRLLELHEKNDEPTDTSYTLEPTSCGAITLRIDDSQGSFYLHSNENPLTEAHCFADYYYDANQENYVIIGMGFAHHIMSFLAKDTYMKLIVLESDIHIIDYVFTYMYMDWYFDNPNVSIYYSEDFSELSSYLSCAEPYSLIIHKPSLRLIKNPALRAQLDEYIISDNSTRVYRDILMQNFRYNSRHCEGNMDELIPLFKDKQIIIVAAGPSLDKNVHLLKDASPHRIILAVGTVYKKLYATKIPIDYVIITDPKPTTYNQIDTLKDSDIPMLLLSTVTRDITKEYKGEKYMICQKGYPPAEQYAISHGYHTYQTGGSVVTTALDICIQSKASSIVFIGLDLAFTGNQVHASETKNDKIVGIEEMLPVPSVDGDIVYTSKPFNKYRKWIEHRAVQDDVTMPIYNATEGGARTENIPNVTLESVLQ